MRYLEKLYGVKVSRRLPLARILNRSESLKARHEADAIMREVNSLYAKGNFEQCFHLLEKTVKLVPSDPRPFYLLGLIHEEMKNYEKAHTSYFMCALIKKNDMNLWKKVLALSSHTKDSVKQVDALERICRREPSEELIRTKMECYNKLNRKYSVIACKIELFEYTGVDEKIFDLFEKKYHLDTIRMINSRLLKCIKVVEAARTENFIRRTITNLYKVSDWSNILKLINEYYLKLTNNNLNSDLNIIYTIAKIYEDGNKMDLKGGLEDKSYSSVIDGGNTLIDSCSTVIEGGNTVIDAGNTLIKSGSAEIETSTANEGGSTELVPSTILESDSNAIESDSQEVKSASENNDREEENVMKAYAYFEKHLNRNSISFMGDNSLGSLGLDEYVLCGLDMNNSKEKKGKSKKRKQKIPKIKKIVNKDILELVEDRNIYDANNTKYIYDLADTLEKFGETEHSIKVLENLYILRKDINALIKIGDLKAKHKLIYEALDCYNNALELNPMNLELKSKLYQIYESIGKKDLSKDFYTATCAYKHVSSGNSSFTKYSSEKCQVIKNKFIEAFEIM